jgi:hypothetical protein
MEITGWRRLLNEPALLSALVNTALVALIAFGVTLTDAQMVAVMGFVNTVLAVAVRTMVTPNQLAEARVAAGVSPTVSRKDTEFAAAAATRTGTGDGKS